jgi:hypothetical protein
VDGGKRLISRSQSTLDLDEETLDHCLTHYLVCTYVQYSTGPAKVGDGTLPSQTSSSSRWDGMLIDGGCQARSQVEVVFQPWRGR